MTEADLRLLLDRDEPDYDVFRGPEAAAWLDALRALVETADDGLASKACYALVVAGGLGSQDDIRGLALAGDLRVVVRLALAGGLLDWRGERPDLVARLLEDEDPGVRKTAIRAAAGTKDPGLLDRLDRLRRNPRELEFLRHAASAAIGG